VLCNIPIFSVIYFELDLEKEISSRSSVNTIKCTQFVSRKKSEFYNENEEEEDTPSDY